MNENEVDIHGKTFEKFITKDEIQWQTREMAWGISKDYKKKNPIFIALLNGAFMFTADLVRACKFDSELMLVSVSSYDGMESTGKVIINSGLDGEILKNRDVIIVEDIIDTGTTLRHFLKHLEQYEPASVAVASLLLKPNVVKFDVPMDYIGFRIPDAFVVGYGLDYNGLGRTLPDIYQLKKTE